MTYKKPDSDTPRSVSSQYLDVKQSGAMASSSGALNPLGNDPFAKLIDQIADLGDTANAGTAISQVYDLKRQCTRLNAEGLQALDEAAAQINASIENLRVINVTLADSASHIFDHPIPGLDMEIQESLRSKLSKLSHKPSS